MVNKVTLIGNLGRDPELRRLESGVSVARFSIATTENYRDKDGNWQDQTEWHEIVLWRQLAERAESQLRKGMLIYLEGKLTTRKWEDKEGNSHKTSEVVASYVRILNRREENSGYSSGSGGGSSSVNPDEKPGISVSSGQNSTSTPSDASNNAQDDADLPF